MGTVSRVLLASCVLSLAACVDEKLEAWTKQLEPFVMEAAGGDGAPTVDEWKYGVNELRAKIASQREHEGFAY